MYSELVGLVKNIQMSRPLEDLYSVSKWEMGLKGKRVTDMQLYLAAPSHSHHNVSMLFERLGFQAARCLDTAKVGYWMGWWWSRPDLVGVAFCLLVPISKDHTLLKEEKKLGLAASPWVNKHVLS